MNGTEEPPRSESPRRVICCLSGGRIVRYDLRFGKSISKEIKKWKRPWCLSNRMPCSVDS